MTRNDAKLAAVGVEGAWGRGWETERKGSGKAEKAAAECVKTDARQTGTPGQKGSARRAESQMGGGGQEHNTHLVDTHRKRGREGSIHARQGGELEWRRR